MPEEYKLAYRGGTGEIVEKKSRFIADVMPVSSEDEAQAFIADIKKKYWDARHHCFAYVIGDRHELARFSDDGEPGGTAGKPMLDVLMGEDIHNVAVVVTRYFGGTLLGTGGLVRAYSGATKEGLAHSQIISRIRGIKLSVDTLHHARFAERSGNVLHFYAEQGTRHARGERIIDVERAEKPCVDVENAVEQVEYVIGAFDVFFHVYRENVRGIFDTVRYSVWIFREDLPSERIVAVDHDIAAPARSQKTLFRRLIVVHRAEIIEVILREVGQYADFEFYILQFFQFHRMCGNLHHHIVDAIVIHFVQKFM